MDPEAKSYSQQLRYSPPDAFRDEIRVLSLVGSATSDTFKSLSLSCALRFKLEHVSLDDITPEYGKFQANQPSSFGQGKLNQQSKVGDGWYKEFQFKTAPADSDKYRAVARFTWGDYTAISYTWGNPEETDTIIIDGVPITIRKNLAAALAHLCRVDPYKTWVDAICINFDDLAERHAYVLRIREVFHNSFAVKIWLGEDEMSSTGLTSRVEEIFDALGRCEFYQTFGQQTLEAALGLNVDQWRESDQYNDNFEAFSYGVLYFDSTSSLDSDDEDESLGFLHFRDLVSLSLGRLFQCEFWSRLWIIQEVAVSPDFSTLHWINSMIRLQTVLKLADIFFDKMGSAGLVNSNILDPNSLCLELLKTISDWQESGVLQGKETGLEGKAAKDLCRLMEPARCAIPQDRVYGVLGLLPEHIQTNVIIDYGRDTQDLISEFTTRVESLQTN